MLGAHRQQTDSLLDMQQQVGNQAAQEAAYDAYSPILEEENKESESSDGYLDALPESPENGYGVYREAEEAPSLPPSDGHYGAYRMIDNLPDGENEGPEAEDQQGSSKGFDMKPMLDGMDEFDSSVQRPNPHMATSLPSTTFYADSAEKREPFARGFGADGRMTNADGSALNTIGADRPAAIGAKGDRHIFTMDGEGQFYSADAIKENKDRAKAAQDSGASQQERFHHSSFLGGKDVAGAGELQVRDGQIETVSDTSGHYRPGSKQMLQTVQQLEKNNASVEKMGVEFVGKNKVRNAEGNLVTEKNLQAPATELLGYSNVEDKSGIESQMRTMHGKKDNVLAELLSKSGGGSDGNLKPSDFKKKAEDAIPRGAQAPAPAPAPAQDPDYVHYDNVYDEAPEQEDEKEEEAYNNVYDEVKENEDIVYNEVDEEALEQEAEDPYNNELYEEIKYM